MKFYLKSQRVLVKGVLSPLAVLIESELISEIVPHGKMNSEFPVVDVGNDVIMPSLVDTHAHINEPGRTEWEGFETATKAALAGGITTVIDMPLNSIPATTSLEALEIKQNSASGRCSVDYGFWGGVVPGNETELPRMVEGGALGFKAFMCESGVPEFQFSKVEDLKLAMPILRDLGVPLLAHAEVEGTSLTHSHDPREYKTYLDARPKSWENNAIKILIGLATDIGTKTHIVHLSSAEALPLIAEAKARKIPITVETCPHYLSLTSEEISAGSTQFKCAPPIREKDNCEGLWKGVESGIIDFLVSDHSPCTPHLKKLEKGDFLSAWGGIASIQFSLPVIWTEMKKRSLPLSLLSKLMSENTARFIGLYKLKGSLEPGKHADILVFDPDQYFVLSEGMIHHKHKLTPYLGKKLFGVVKSVYLRGTLSYKEGKFESINQGMEIRR